MSASIVDGTAIGRRNRLVKQHLEPHILRARRQDLRSGGRKNQWQPNQQQQRSQQQHIGVFPFHDYS